MNSPWMPMAVAELARDVHELPGAADNPRIVQYHATTTLKATDDETPWCSSFVNWCVTQAGLTGTNSAAASSWKYWGHAVGGEDGEIRCGDIAVLSRVGGHHVGFVVAIVETTVLLLGGNQGNRVSVAPFPVQRIVALRRLA